MSKVVCKNIWTGKEFEVEEDEYEGLALRLNSSGSRPILRLVGKKKGRPRADTPKAEEVPAEIKEEAKEDDSSDKVSPAGTQKKKTGKSK